MLEDVTRKLRKEIAKRAGGIEWCPKGGQHFAKSRADSAKCQKCGMTIKDIKAQIKGNVTERYPEGIGK